MMGVGEENDEEELWQHYLKHEKFSLGKNIDRVEAQGGDLLRFIKFTFIEGK